MSGIREAAEKLSEREDRYNGLSEKFQNVETLEKDSVVKESFLAKEIEVSEPETVVGVDGGVLKKRYSSGDVIAARAVAAVFRYSEKVEVDYIPSRSPEPEFQVFDSRDANSIDRNAETERLKQETSVVLKSLGKGRVLVDGSVVPSYLDEEEVLENYNRIFEKADPGQLVGVVEDSYGLKLSDILEEKLGIEIGDVRDTVLMDAVLEGGERSFVRKYSASPVEHPVLKELEDQHVNRLYTFYVKLSDRDIPLRIDYYGKPEDANEIAAVLGRVKTSESYTIPAPIMEADKRAKISETYIKRLEKRFSPETKRRDRRSF